MTKNEAVILAATEALSHRLFYLNAETVKTRMKSCGLTQQKVADALQRSQSDVSQKVNGHVPVAFYEVLLIQCMLEADLADVLADWCYAQVIEYRQVVRGLPAEVGETFASAFYYEAWEDHERAGRLLDKAVGLETLFRQAGEIASALS